MESLASFSHAKMHKIAEALIKAGGKELLLSTLEDGTSWLYTACEQGYHETVKALIKAGGEAILLKTLKDGCSCLFIA